ncbi:MAG TPA: PH domain-containing protein [Candidatus Limnocylindrales bacterium]
MARYADRLLADGERPILRSRQHLLAPFIEGRTAIAILIASAVLIVLNAQLPAENPLRPVLGYATLILLLIAIAWLGVIFISWYSEDYLVTNRRVLKVDGILRKRSADSSLEKINDAILEQSVLGRILNYGDLEILTAAETPVDHYSYLAGAPTFKRTMLDAKHALEQEVFDFPGPPLRAGAAAGPPAAQPVTAAAAATPAASDGGGGATARSMSSEEITRALGNLADLRDRGAISAEDFEAKKQDLLGRL